MVVLRSGFRPPLLAARAWRRVAVHLPPLNFITLHYAYFIGVCLVSSVIFWGSSTPPRSVSYIDSLFLVVSAMTLAGLNTVNLSEVNTFQQFILFLLIMLGSAILISIVVVHTRRKAFERRFKSIWEQKRARGSFMRRMSFSKSRTRDAPGENRAAIRGTAIKVEEPAEGRQEEKPEGKPDEEEKGEKIDRSAEASNGAVGLPAITANEDHQNGEALELASTKQQESNEAKAEKPLVIDTGVSRRITFASSTSPKRQRIHSPIFSMQGVGARGDLLNHPKRSLSGSFDLPTVAEHEPLRHIAHPQSAFGFLSSVLVGRNSQFSGLTLAERERLGGVEYRAVTILAWVVPLYFVLWQLLGCIGLGAYVANIRPEAAAANGENPWQVAQSTWVGAFNGVSAFNNSGMSLLDANMVAFQTSDYMLITMSLMILAGNTCYPLFLRLILWTIWKLLPDYEEWHEHKHTLRFLLDHPRRCYTNLFPARHTWWLVAALIGLNTVDWAAFEVLNIGNPVITSLPQGARALDGLFQAFAVRSGGFYVVPIANLRVGLLILYVIMMYISVYPVVITIRNSNVYEERSLGIYADDPQPDARPPFTDAANGGAVGGIQRSNTFSTIRRVLASNPNRSSSNNNNNSSGGQETRSYFVRQQLRGQLAHDIWWIVLAVLFICITETSQFERDPVVYSVFNVLFEVVSAYGCVGISVGLPNVAYSFCGGWHTLSKLILCAVMLRGRHRGLPVAIDRAVLLPGDHLAMAEEEDAKIRADRARASAESGAGVVATAGV